MACADRVNRESGRVKEAERKIAAITPATNTAAPINHKTCCDSRRALSIDARGAVSVSWADGRPPGESTLNRQVALLVPVPWQPASASALGDEIAHCLPPAVSPASRLSSVSSS